MSKLKARLEAVLPPEMRSAEVWDIIIEMIVIAHESAVSEALTHIRYDKEWQQKGKS